VCCLSLKTSGIKWSILKAVQQENSLLIEERLAFSSVQSFNRWDEPYLIYLLVLFTNIFTETPKLMFDQISGTL
jgi:hypothetical protein